MVSVWCFCSVAITSTAVASRFTASIWPSRASSRLVLLLLLASVSASFTAISSVFIWLPPGAYPLCFSNLREHQVPAPAVPVPDADLPPGLIPRRPCRVAAARVSDPHSKSHPFHIGSLSEGAVRRSLTEGVGSLSEGAVRRSLTEGVGRCNRTIVRCSFAFPFC